jgi:hypothetical protein
MNTKCTRYIVDPSLLNAGIPVECLEKKNIQVVREPEELKTYIQGSILHPNEVIEHPKPPDKLEIELGLSDYSKVKAGELIKISPEIAKRNGEKIKIRNKGTDNYVVRTLIVVGNRGYFQ